MKNIDAAFRSYRLFCIAVIIASVCVSCFVLYKSFKMVSQMQETVYILSNDKVLQATASSRKENIAVEARDHVKCFHQLFFSLDPDEKVIHRNIGNALYLCDQSAKQIYDDLKENNYYGGIISGNISQTIEVDSIQIDCSVYPYRFSCYAREKIIRSSTILYRSLITSGGLRTVERSDNNPHGFLIENWKIIENKDIANEVRKQTMIE